MKVAPDLEEQTPKSKLEVPESMVYFVYTTVFIDVLAACISTPVMPYYAKSFGVSVQWIGYLYATWSFCSTVFAPKLVQLADTWGRKRVLVMCLVGAGVANVIQGVAILLPAHVGPVPLAFGVFVFGRGFSGVWASIGATCQVYIADVAAADIRGPYLEKLSMVPIFAILLGPGLGGALATGFGNNVPILIDGIVTLLSAIVVMQNLVETPAFLRLKAREAEGPQTTAGGATTTKADVPKAIYVLGFGAFLASIANQGNLSMYALYFSTKFGLSPLYTGFVFVLISISMLQANMMILPLLKKLVDRPAPRMVIGGCTLGTFIFCMGFSENLWVSLACMYCAMLGSAITSSQQNVVVASLTSDSNRGKIVSTVQLFSNCGKIVGPVCATHLAAWYGPGFPFRFTGCCTLCSAAVMVLVPRFMNTDDDQKKQPFILARSETAFGDAWENEVGSEKDANAIGKYVAKLLEDRHYKWLTRREDIERLLDSALPALEIQDRDHYEHSLKDCRSRQTHFD